jgi:hypothetical protein
MGKTLGWSGRGDKGWGMREKGIVGSEKMGMGWVIVLAVY